MPISDESLDIWNKVKDKSEKEIRGAAKDLVKIGRDALNDFLRDIKDTVSSDTAKQIAELYARAEAKALSGQSVSAMRVIQRLNLTSRAAANVKRSQTIKKAIAVWDSALKVLITVATRLAGIGSAGLSDLVSAGVDAASDLVDSAMQPKKSSKKKSSSKKTSSKKKKTEPDPKEAEAEAEAEAEDEDIVIDDD